MKINWEKINNSEQYVKETLAKEADDIPENKISAGKWVLKTLKLDKLQVDEEMVSDHDKEDLHIKRRDSFIESIENYKPIKPLIALGRNRFLVDGYARFRACKKLGITKAQVFVQSFD